MGIKAMTATLADRSSASVQAIIRGAKLAAPTIEREPPAIVETLEADHDAAIADALRALDVAEDDASRRRLELGRALVRARSAWPASGPKARGWGELLERHGISSQRASEWMRLAGYVDEVIPPSDGEIEVPTMREAGIDKRPRASDDDAADEEHVTAAGERALVREPNDPHATVHVERESLPSSSTPAPDAAPEPDRNSWCTPKWIADAVGVFDLDPASNPRSHIRAGRSCELERGEDGLTLAAEIDAGQRVWINPPYARGQVIRWIRAYKHTRFCFLVKVDPSTEWFAELFEASLLILLPRGTRIEFEPPPGVAGDSNQFPHGLFFAHVDDATPEIWAKCFAWKTRI